jgi:tetratricopeptide (TPR) repeat protein
LYLDRRFPEHSFSSEIVEWFQTRSGGNALCLTALVEHAVAHRWIVEEGSNWRAGVQLSQWGADLPQSILGMIAKKMGELCQADRDVLHASALYGTQFEAAVISRALQFDGVAVEHCLGRLEKAHHVLRYLGETRLMDGTWTECYRFDHPLYREALLNELGPERRRRLCRQIAEAVVGIHPEAERSRAYTVARLFEEGGAVAAALSYYVRAALNAAQMSAYKQVSDVTKRASDLARSARRTRSVAASEVQLLTLQAVSAANLGGWDAPELERLYNRARDAGRVLGDASAALNVGHVYCTYMSTIDCQRGCRVANSLRRIACASKRPQPIASATMTNGVTHLNLGQIPKAVSLLREARRVCVRISKPPTFLTFPVPPQVATHSLLARALWFFGRPQEASEASLRGVEAARKLGHERTLAYASALAADVAHLRRDAAETIRWAEIAIALAQEHELRYERIWASSWRAWALVETGEPEAAISIFQEFLEDYHGPATVIMQCHYAEALGRTGDLSWSAKALDRAFEVMADQGERYYESELHRVRGELLLMRKQLAVADIKSAMRFFRSANAIAHQQGAKSCELRAATSLARASLTFGVPGAKKALSALSEIFNQLRPWGETADLREARQLLVGRH